MLLSHVLALQRQGRSRANVHLRKVHLQLGGAKEAMCEDAVCAARVACRRGVEVVGCGGGYIAPVVAAGARTGGAIASAPQMEYHHVSFFLAAGFLEHRGKR